MKAKISFTGDLLCYPSITEGLGGKYDFCFENGAKLKECDLLVGNLETPVAGEELKYTHERYCFNTPTEFIEAMKRCGFDLLTLANNHAMDRGEKGILKTLENCRRAGFDTVGMYATKKERDTLYIKELNGIRVAIINYTYGVNSFAHKRFFDHKYMVNMFQPEETLPGSIHLLNSNEEIGADLDRIYFGDGKEFELVKPYLEQLEDDIKRAKEEADCVIMVMHSGGQYNDEVDPYTRFIAQKIKEFGADIIVGHHPHIIQKSRVEDGYLTVFCLGNLLDDPVLVGEKDIDHTFSAVLHLTIEKDEKGKVSIKRQFSIYRVTVNEGIPQINDSYDLYTANPDPRLERDILHFANRFANTDGIKAVAERYDI